MRQRSCRYVRGSIGSGDRKCLAVQDCSLVSAFETAAYATLAMSYRQLHIGYSRSTGL